MLFLAPAAQFLLPQSKRGPVAVPKPASYSRYGGGVIKRPAGIAAGLVVSVTPSSTLHVQQQHMNRSVKSMGQQLRSTFT
jgi:hypothetical protein